MVAGPKLMDFSRSRMHATATRTRLTPATAAAAVAVVEQGSAAAAEGSHGHKTLHSPNGHHARQNVTGMDVMEVAQEAAAAGQPLLIRNQVRNTLTLHTRVVKVVLVFSAMAGGSPYLSRLAPRASRLAPRASRPRASRLAPRASRLVPHASYALLRLLTRLRWRAP